MPACFHSIHIWDNTGSYVIIKMNPILFLRRDKLKAGMLEVTEGHFTPCLLVAGNKDFPLPSCNSVHIDSVSTIEHAAHVRFLIKSLAAKACHQAQVLDKILTSASHVKCNRHLLSPGRFNQMKSQPIYFSTPYYWTIRYKSGYFPLNFSRIFF